MGVVTDDRKLIMQKSKSASSSGSRLNPRKIWRSRSKSQSRGSGSSSSSSWAPQGSGLWMCSSGRQVVLTDTHLLNLSEVEVVALRQVALAKLQAMDLDCRISIPKVADDSVAEKPKRRALILKKRAVTTGFFEQGNKDCEGNDNRSSGMVFGVPLVKCVRNDRAARRSASAPLRDVANLIGARLKSGSASAEDISNERLLSSRGFSGSQISCNIPLELTRDEKYLEKNNEGSCESLGWVCKSRSVSGLSMLDGYQDWIATDVDGVGSCFIAGGDSSPHIPNVVNTCFHHLESYGLHRLGIFRVSSSKKRVRQLREDFDTGKEVQLSKEHCPHDVATLLKEYFRDLPEPLLTRDLYLAFIATQKIRNRRQQIDALRHLVELLPVANRDTLWALLKFLSKVASFAVDQRKDTGEWVAGNKMDANNLATLFGPNILHMAKSGLSHGTEYQVESTKRAEERIEVIKAVRSMIDNYKDLFEVPASLLEDVYIRLLKHNPEDLSRLLIARILPLEIEMDPDTGSSACSETTSVSHLPIDVTMESNPAPLVISVCAELPARSWERTMSTSESIDDENLTVRHQRRDSEKSNGDRPERERGGSLGREVFAKTESVASRLFRRRDKSVARGSSDESKAGGRSSLTKSDIKVEDNQTRWFKKKDSSSASKTSDSEEKKQKKPKKECRFPVSRGSLSEGSIGSDSRSSSLKSASAESTKSLVRPLMFQEMGNAGIVQVTSSAVPSTHHHHHQQVSVVDIRKEHLHVPEVSERRPSTTPDLDNNTVISASLTLKVPLSRSQTGPSLAFGQDRDIDIPFIEDNQPEAVETQKTCHIHSRQRYLDRRHRSSPFFQKLVGGGNVDSTSSNDSPSRQTSRTRHRPSTSEPNPLSTSASASSIHSANIRIRGTERPGRVVSNESNEPSSRRTSSQVTIPRQQEQSQQRSCLKNEAGPSSSSSSSGRRSSGTGNVPWKRWEIISSEHTEQETVV